MMDIPAYTPLDWHWRVAETGRVWSSAACAYVDSEPPHLTLIKTEAELADVLAPYGIEGPLSLSAIKDKYKAKVDDDAEAVRLQHITRGVGQAMTYAEKKDQAVAVIAMGEAAANGLANNGAMEFPTLSASVPLEANSLYAAAQLIMQRYEAWAALSRMIETARLAGKKNISLASDAAAVRAAYGAITWPSS